MSNKSYNVTITSSRPSDKMNFETSAVTWADLEQELHNRNVTTSGMQIFMTPGFVQLGNIPFTPIQKDANSPVDIVLVFSPAKMKSGGYAEDKAFIKECFSQKDNNSHYASVFASTSKSYTRMTKEELSALAEALRGGSSAPAPAPAAVSTSESSKSSKSTTKNPDIMELAVEINRKLDMVLERLNNGVQTTSSTKSFLEVQKEMTEASSQAEELLNFLGR
jgi:hypothetical protein